jgi:hypothetical protein
MQYAARIDATVRPGGFVSRAPHGDHAQLANSAFSLM